MGILCSKPPPIMKFSTTGKEEEMKNEWDTFVPPV